MFYNEYILFLKSEETLLKKERKTRRPGRDSYTSVHISLSSIYGICLWLWDYEK